MNKKNTILVETDLKRIIKGNNIAHFMNTYGQSEADCYIFGINKTSLEFGRIFSYVTHHSVIGYIGKSKAAEELVKIKFIPLNEFNGIINSENRKNIRVIVFTESDEDYKILVGIGLNPFTQIFDGYYIYSKVLEEDIDVTLHKYNKNFYFSGYGSKQEGIYKFSRPDNTYQVVRKGDYRGLTKYKNGYIALENNNGIDFFDEAFSFNFSIEAPDLDFHDIIIHPQDDNIIITSETRYDRLGIYEIHSGKKIDQIEIRSIFKSNYDDFVDHFHINDIVINDKYLYVSLMSINGGLNSISWFNDGAILEIDMNKNKINRVLKKDMLFPHTIFCLNECMLYCETGNGRVFCDSQILCEYNGLLRGLDFDGYTLYIGQSSPRHITKELFALKKTILFNAGIYFYEPYTKSSQFYPIREVEEIYDILVI